MKRFLSIAFAIAFATISANAQELIAKVSINHTQVNQTKSDVFEALQEKVTSFLNDHQWTGMQYKEVERISCNFNITVNTYSETDNSFKCTLLMTCSRPVYNSTYNTTLYSIKDDDFNFEFQTTDQLEFSGANNLNNNLVAMLSYYAYMIIGYDMDAMSPMGGTDLFKIAEDIVTNATDLGTGWKAYDDPKNRFGLLNDYLDGSMECYRNLVYKYHRDGLDHMADDPDGGRAAIIEAMSLLDEAHQAKSMSQLPQLFTEYKREELINIFKGKGTSSEREGVADILNGIDVSQNAKWDEIRK